MDRPLTRRRDADRAGRPIILALLVMMLVPGLVRAQGSVPLEFREDAATGLATVIPVGWTPLGQGLHARLPDASDFTLIAVQSAPATPDQVWMSLLPQLGLAVAPDPAGTRQTPFAEFTLYQVDVDGPTGTIGVDVALTEDGGTTYLVLFQALRPEFAELRSGVFLPAVDALTTVTPQPTPDAATLPYTAEEVTFSGGDPDVTLAGTLTVPRTQGPHAAIVLVGGSGPQDRDETLRPISAIKPLGLLADALSRAGMAVLRYDDRGVAGSTGDYAMATLSDFTDDLAAALAWVRDRPEVDATRTGVLGHSEGGVYIASLIEAGAPLAFAVGLAPPATNGVDLLVAQNGAILAATGATAEEVDLAEAYARDLYASVLADDLPAAEAATRAYFGAYFDRLAPELQATIGDRATFIDAQVRRQLATVDSPWFGDLLRSDAGIGWDRAEMPVLGVFGGKDVQVVAAQNAPLMEAQLTDGHPASRVVTLPDANHLLQAAGTGSVAEYGSLEPVFTPDLLPLLTAWVTEQVGLPVPDASVAP